MKTDKCRLCKGPLGAPVLDLGSTPLANEFLSSPSPQDLFPLQVCCCASCGHYQLNQSIDPERIFRHYHYVAGTSPVNVEHFRKYAVSMVEKFDLKPGSKILEIASNDGVMLQHFKDLGMKVMGIDPARNIADEANKKGIETITEFFTEAYADKMLKEHGQFDLIVANNVFAHCPDLVDFTKGVKKLLAPQGVFVFEVSYFADVCDHTLFDTIYHEHSSYHTVGPLRPFFTGHGLDLFDVERIPNHGGSIRVFVRCQEDFGLGRWYRGALSAGLGDLPQQEQDIEKKVKQLAHNIKYLGLELREKLRDLRDQDKSIAIYGAPAKATTLMYALGIKEEWIDFAVDDAPLKQGTFTPGKHILIYTSQAILERKPDVLLILAWNFADSIIEKCQQQWYQHFKNVRYPTFIVPLPELKVQRYCENMTCTCSDGPWIEDPKYSGSFNGIKIGGARCQSCGGIDRGMPWFPAIEELTRKGS
jgi:SAM-dependent methyltransferase